MRSEDELLGIILALRTDPLRNLPSPSGLIGVLERAVIELKFLRSRLPQGSGTGRLS
jgi:hypothetical protein